MNRLQWNVWAMTVAGLGEEELEKFTVHVPGGDGIVDLCRCVAVRRQEFADRVEVRWKFDYAGLGNGHSLWRLKDGEGRVLSARWGEIPGKPKDANVTIEWTMVFPLLPMPKDEG